MGTAMALLYAGCALLWPFYTLDGHCYGASIRRMGTALALLYAGWALLWPFYTPDGHCFGLAIRRMGTAVALLYAGWALVFANPISQLFDSKNSSLHEKSKCLHRFPSTELTVPKTYGNIVYKPYNSIKHTGIVFANPISQSVQLFNYTTFVAVSGSV